MSYDWYTKACLRTWKKRESETRKERISEATLGLCGEIDELINGDISKRADELGDVFWYMYILAFELQIRVEDSNWYLDLTWDPTNALCEQVKKNIYHGKDNLPKIEALLGMIQGYVPVDDLDVEEVKAANIEKLKARYPEGFSQTKKCDNCGGDIGEHYDSNRCIGCDHGEG